MVLSLLANLILPLSFFFLLRKILGQIVSEKESGMKEYLLINGCDINSYHLSYLVSEGILAFLHIFAYLGTHLSGYVYLSYVSKIEHGFVIRYKLTPFSVYLKVKEIHDAINQNRAINHDETHPYLLMLFPHHNFNKVQYSLFSEDKFEDNHKINRQLYFIMQGFDIVFYFILNMIIENRRVIYKNFKRLRYQTKNAQLNKKNIEDEADLLSQKNNEKFSEARNPFLQYVNVTKKFGSYKAVDNLSLNLFKNQIFCLLGHNGAGKTTALNILTGNHRPNQGTIYMRSKTQGSLDITQDINMIRLKLGLCQQHDILFEQLTIQQHLELICRLKLLSQAKIKDRISEILETVALTKDRNKKVKELSGGMKRRLSIAMGIVAESEVLILDEPTTGLDPIVRDMIWNLIKDLKKDRCILMTTQHLEEAEQLADSLALLETGKLVSQGSVDDIKKRFGVGYNLKISNRDESIISQDRLDQLKELVSFHVPGSYLKQNELFMRSSVEYILHINQIDNYHRLFRELENIQDITFKVVLNSLEEAFLNFSNVKKQNLQSAESSESSKIPFDDSKKVGNIIISQTKGILLKRWYNFKRDWRMWGLLVLPLVIIFIVITYGFVKIKELESYDKLYNSTSKANLKPVQDQKIINELNQVRGVNISDKNAAKQKGNNDVDPQFQKYFDDEDDEFFKPQELPETETLEEIMLKEAEKRKERMMKEGLEYAFEIMYAVWIVLSLSLCSGMFVEIPVKERFLKLRYYLKVIGVNQYVYWFANLLFDMFIISFWVGIMIAVIYPLKLNAFIIEIEKTLILLISFGFAHIGLSYFVSFWFTSADSAIKVFSFIYMTGGFFFPFLIKNMIFLSFGCEAFHLAEVICAFVPLQPLYIGMKDIIWSAHKDFLDEQQSKTKQMNEFKNVPAEAQKRFEEAKQLADSCPNNFTTINECLTVLLVSGVFYLVSVILLENIRERRLRNSEKKATIEEDQKEKEIMEQSVHEKNNIRTIQVSKTYNGKVMAVKNCSFNVKENSIYGLLGPNGAGKSSTFNMLTLQIQRTGGRIEIQKQSISDLKTFRPQDISISAQDLILWPNLTIMDHFKILGQFLGYQPTYSMELYEYISKKLDLDKPDKLQDILSGGNKRKLQTALTIFANPSIIFLDEPTVGLDPVARRSVLQLVKQQNTQHNTNSVLFTTHRLDEAEYLCDQVAIMIGGEIVCMGSPDYLKSQYADSFLILVKNPKDQILNRLQKLIQRQNPDISLDQINEQVQLFNSNTASDNQVQEVYKVDKKSAKISQLFEELVKMKSVENVIEDFSFFEASLQQVFVRINNLNQ
ncbi:abc transporter family protein [Stylonychia lemnae]|uniref:Abc transporter family protein n=1 Tax=Stylonychia lemnae TaxID=5949 RepID=A0A078AIC9_STYLE|nr:abc transporter family protein [Stylonychia lemnae]|eukprot:CDW82000.1 abc transporter family protein [Stylonychia lemnae]